MILKHTFLFIINLVKLAKKKYSVRIRHMVIHIFLLRINVILLTLYEIYILFIIAVLNIKNLQNFHLHFTSLKRLFKILLFD